MDPVQMNLEWWKLSVSALTPMAIVIAGYFINKSLKASEHAHTELLRKQDVRKILYDEIAPNLNRIFCFVSDIGDFANYEPEHIIDAKRSVDTKFFTYKKLWSDATVRAYQKFLNSCFDTYSGGVGTPARIRSATHEKKAWFSRVGKTWKAEWDTMFAPPLNKQAVSDAYYDMVRSFIVDITSSGTN